MPYTEVSNEDKNTIELQWYLQWYYTRCVKICDLSHSALLVFLVFLVNRRIDDVLRIFCWSCNYQVLDCCVRFVISQPLLDSLLDSRRHAGPLKICPLDFLLWGVGSCFWKIVWEKLVIVFHFAPVDINVVVIPASYFDSKRTIHFDRVNSSSVTSRTLANELYIRERMKMMSFEINNGSWKTNTAYEHALIILIPAQENQRLSW